MRTQLIIILSLLNVCLVPAQERDTRVRTYITPTRIVWQQDSDHITNCNFLLNQGDGQAYWGAYYDYESIDTGLQGKKEKTVKAATYCRLSSTDGARPAILLDFGKELHGGVQLVTGAWPSHKPVKIRLRYGESVSEAMSDIDGKGGATNDHAIRDQELILPWLGVYETGNSGFRFVRIDLLDTDAILELKEVRAISIMRDIPYRGSFQCNDEKLNTIWRTGAYTVHLNMQNHLWDGIKRDRLVWIGDSYPEVMTVNSVFGYNEVVPKSLDLMRDITPLPHWMNAGFSSYSIWWLLCHYEWYRYHGNKAYLEQSRDYITALLRQLMTQIAPDGQECLDGTRFLDWPSNSNKDAIAAGLQALMVWGMRVGVEFAELFEDMVYLRTLLDDNRFIQSPAKLTAAIGVDVAGDPIYVDLAKMPHLLIAGTTGSGKSVCLNCLILSMLYKATPDEVKLIMIDPKKVEFNVYNGLPHLIIPVVSSAKKAAGALSWAVSEMERRYELIETVGVRDIKNYNRITANDPDKEYMPQLVIIIDELADLMMTAPTEVEESICRIAQKGRAYLES